MKTGTLEPERLQLKTLTGAGALGIAAERVLTPAWHASVLLLAFALPFEFSTPWLGMGSALVFTNVELVALASLALWTVRQVAVKAFPRWRTPLTAPVVLLLLALLLASGFAPDENLHAFKVTARWIAGALVGWMVLNAVETGLPLRRVIQASVLGGVIVAALACLEVNDYGGVRAWLTPFRNDALFRVGGEVRVSSTLAYPTIAAMYLEIIFFLVVGWLALELKARRITRAAALAGALLLVSAAISFTLTRSALIAIGLATGGIVLARWRRFGFDTFARTAGAATLSLGLIVLGASINNPQMQLRLASESDRSWYRASYDPSSLPALKADQQMTTSVRVQNIGQVTWEAHGPRAVHLSYHWLSADARYMLQTDGARTDLPRDIAPGESIELQAKLYAPAQAGDYVLEWDMVREDLFWFSVLGAPTHRSLAHVEPTPATRAAPKPTASSLIQDLNLDRLTLWKTALKMLAAHPLLGIGPGNFRLMLGAYLDLARWDERLHANNMYLELFADSGLIGGLAFLVLVFAVLRLIGFGTGGMFGRGGQLPVPTEDRILLASLGGALVAFFIHGVTDYFLEFTPTYLLFWMMLGLLVGGMSLERSRA